MIDSESKPSVADGRTVPDWDGGWAVMRQIREALRCLVERREPRQIDLRGQPFAPGDLERLLGWLGRGEVAATVTALGPTRVWESAIPGVWVVEHRDGEERPLALQIEVAEVPAILRSQPEDLERALALLDERLGASSAGQL
ncbi:hydrogenase expression/formation C-terminal domain-containing protein [Thioalkalicoccus limnaeus]|uniref:Hydrogenase expression/formation C-terminal domain-containing protein n=1 Tax=Thioalkalicoccus limnaeus TaxID=120681 RepID=A0ABV4BGB2_9GAMM